MIRRLALALAASISVLSTISVAAASTDDAAVEIEPAAPTFAAGADALFHVTVSGEPGFSSLDYSAEGGTVSGALALNELADGSFQGAVFVRRDAPGEATLVASHEGAEVARATATFVEGAPVTVEVTLDAGSEAAARTWFFDILDASGIERGFVQVGTSGDRPTFAVASQPLPYGDYTVRPALGNDVASDCTGSAFFTMSPSSPVSTSVTSSGATAVFTVRTCASESVPQGAAPTGAPGGAQAESPRPPATGSGSQETPRLQEWQVDTLGRLMIGVAGVLVLGVLLTRFLARVAPLKTPEKKQ